MKAHAFTAYHRRVQRDRERIAREERKARGEKNDTERWADELTRRIQAR